MILSGASGPNFMRESPGDTWKGFADDNRLSALIRLSGKVFNS